MPDLKELEDDGSGFHFVREFWGLRLQNDRDCVPPTQHNVGFNVKRPSAADLVTPSGEGAEVLSSKPSELERDSEIRSRSVSNVPGARLAVFQGGVGVAGVNRNSERK